jgi:hypothetical protein
MVDLIATALDTVVPPPPGQNLPFGHHDTAHRKLAIGQRQPRLAQGGRHKMFVFAHMFSYLKK